MADRLRAEDAARAAAIKRATPILGPIALALKPLPDRGATWAKGADGERRFGATLDELMAADAPILVLHDRRIPRTKANIDHLAVTPTGVWVIDAKHHAGQVRSADRGRTLRVGGRDRTKLVDGVHRQVEVVRRALAGSPFAGVPVQGALCFIGADWTWFAKPFSVDGVVVAWGKALRQRLVASGTVAADQRAGALGRLTRALPPAVAPS